MRASIVRGVFHVAAAILAVAMPLGAAPLPPIAPASPCGTVRQVRWLPPRTLAAVPGMSGSAGRERHWPERAVVVLGEVRGIPGELRRRINGLLTTSHDGAGVRLAPGQLLLVLASPRIAGLRPTARICVDDFVVRGDEGGTWTSHRPLRVIRRAHPVGAITCSPARPARLDRSASR